jgi:release factor glutamine methyltransferase
MNLPPDLFRAGATPAQIERARLLDPLEQRILLCHVLGWSRIELITRGERPLDGAQAAALDTLFRRRLAGEPIAYLVGRREFFGLPLAVSPAVLIPRPDTELLVELALERLDGPARVLDLGTGSGAIALAIAANRPGVQVTALDLSADALAVAEGNARSLGLRNVRFARSDWYAQLHEAAPFDLIVSNPPYIPAGDVHLAQGDLRFEPQDALTDHADGLTAYRAIVAGMPAHLRAGGWLLLEHGYDQAAQVRALLDEAGMNDVESWRDLAGIERVTGGRRPA